MHLRTDAILRLAAEPAPFDIPDVRLSHPKAVDDWREAAAAVAEAATVRQARHQATGAGRLNRTTLDFIRDSAATGDRHRLLFSAAAANLAELHCPPAPAHELLTEAELDSGLPPGEVRRQIDCGLEHGAGISTRSPTITATDADRDATGDTRGTATDPTRTDAALQAALSALWKGVRDDHESELHDRRRRFRRLAG